MEGTRRAVVAAFFLNLAIAASKFVAAYFSASTAMFAEALHSLADTFNQVFLYLGLTLEERKPDPRHPFGYGRERYFWSFVAAVFIFVAGALASLYEGYEKWHHPTPLGDVRWAAVVLVVAFVLEGASFRIGLKALQEGAREAGMGTWAAFKASRDPTLAAVLLEDGAALVGILLAGAGLGLGWWTGVPRWDAAGSIAVGLLLAVAALVLGRRSHALLIGMAAAPADRERIRAVFDRAPEVEELVSAYTILMSPSQLFLAADVRLREDLDTTAVAEVIDRLHAELRREVHGLAKIFIEVQAPSRVQPTKEGSTWQTRSSAPPR
jgi:cation diffusion facilitator family transporter